MSEGAEIFTVRRKFDYDILRPMGDTGASRHIAQVMDVAAWQQIGHGQYRFVTTRPQFAPDAFCLQIDKGDVWLMPVVEDYGQLVKTIIAVAQVKESHD